MAEKATSARLIRMYELPQVSASRPRISQLSCWSLRKGFRCMRSVFRPAGEVRPAAQSALATEKFSSIVRQPPWPEPIFAGETAKI